MVDEEEEDGIGFGETTVDTIGAASVVSCIGPVALVADIAFAVRRNGGGETVLVCALRGVDVSRSSRFLLSRASRSASIAFRLRPRRVFRPDGGALDSELIFGNGVG